MTESPERPLSWKKGDVKWSKPGTPPEHAPACILMPDGRPLALDHPDAVEQPGDENDREPVQGPGALEEPGGGEAVRSPAPGT